MVVCSQPEKSVEFAQGCDVFFSDRFLSTTIKRVLWWQKSNILYCPEGSVDQNIFFWKTHTPCSVLEKSSDWKNDRIPPCANSTSFYGVYIPWSNGVPYKYDKSWVGGNIWISREFGGHDIYFEVYKKGGRDGGWFCDEKKKPLTHSSEPMSRSTCKMAIFSSLMYLKLVTCAGPGRGSGGSSSSSPSEHQANIKKT